MSSFINISHTFFNNAGEQLKLIQVSPFNEVRDSIDNLFTLFLLPFLWISCPVLNLQNKKGKLHFTKSITSAIVVVFVTASNQGPIGLRKLISSHLSEDIMKILCLSGDKPNIPQGKHFNNSMFTINYYNFAILGGVVKIEYLQMTVLKLNVKRKTTLYLFFHSSVIRHGIGTD